KILNQMAGELNFTWFNEAILTDDRAISELINGFFSASNYHFEYPIDQHVEINKRIASKLITRDLFTQKENFVLKKSKEILRKVLPHFIIQMLKNLRYKILNKKQLTGVYAYQGEIASTR